MAGDLADRVAVITAAGSGMGREASLLFAAEGAHVVLIDINADAAASVVDQIHGAGGSAEAQGVDMTDLSQIEAAIDKVGSDHGRIDVLYNHAGAAGPRGFEFDEQVWDFQVNINLRSAVFLTKAALPLMGQNGRGGSVLFTSSVSGIIASRNSPVYAALKAGVIGFMRCIAAIGGGQGIRANAILPGATETPMLQQFFAAPGESAEVLDERLASFMQAIPLGRFCKPEEVAQLALFLASDRSSFLTGVAIPIDGGYTAL
ncbi:MAG TPA: SDR family NAD(P)-dependent oxidoreductase [Solirubrobacteraceae bacterium]|jgi:NAD(P)-dependent dehydrogenase (short-subunit alcohol dehydrogenase family)